MAVPDAASPDDGRTPSGEAPPADPDGRRERRRYVFSGRASFGLGAGRLGFAGRVGLAGEYWLTRTFAIGVAAARVGQTSAEFLGAGTNASAWVITPVAGVRSQASGGYFFGTLGAGYALATRTNVYGLCINITGGACGGPEEVAAYSGYGVSGAVGWLGHPGKSSFEVGPVLRFDAVGDFPGDQPVDYLVTLNLELGLADLGSR